jgi:hypothetical protein
MAKCGSYWIVGDYMYRVIKITDVDGIVKYSVYDAKNRKDLATFSSQIEAYSYIDLIKV